jgi:CheY-like chemotaxis protein
MDEQATVNPPAPAEPELPVQVSQDDAQGLLAALSEAYEEIKRLKSDNAALRESLASAGQAVPAAASAESPGDGVLIVDDSKLLQIRMRHSVEALGYDVVGLADSAEAALQVLVKTNPRVVILDYLLPGMSGLECLQLIRRQRPNVRVIVCSSELTAKTSKAFLAAGANDILVKPVQQHSLEQSLRRWMGNS